MKTTAIDMIYEYKEVLLLAIVCVLTNGAAAFDTNVTLSELSRCKELRIDKGPYTYNNNFVRLDSLQNNQPLDSEILRLRFYVQTSHDAALVLTTEPRANSVDRVNEVVLGNYQNTKSTIRTVLIGPQIVVETPGAVVSELYPTKLTVVMSKDYVLSVYLSDESWPYLQYKNPTPFDAKYISVTSWGEYTPARWYYDCRIEDSTTGGNYGKDQCENKPNPDKEAAITGTLEVMKAACGLLLSQM